MVVDAIKAAGYDRYKFTADGQGCRYWVGNVLEILEQRSISANSSQVNAAQEALKKVWDRSGVPVGASSQTGVSPGTFY